MEIAQRDLASMQINDDDPSFAMFDQDKTDAVMREKTIWLPEHVPHSKTTGSLGHWDWREWFACFQSLYFRVEK